jgi:hydroxyacylglutathione hydrolase
MVSGGMVPASTATRALHVEWIHGSPDPHHRSDPPIQVYAHDDRTYILRQSKDVSFEAPFLFLFLGEDRALLLDTGATADARAFPLKETVSRLLSTRQDRSPHGEYGLVVAHTHSHGDHVAGDVQFRAQSGIVVVDKDLSSVQRYFGLSPWPDGIAQFDLGGRVLEVFGIPGHHATSIALYDRRSRFLVTGDTVYPGRLYVHDISAFVASLNRLVTFTENRRVDHVMGCHVEMTRTPGRDYPFGARFQPHERPLEMSVVQLAAVRDAAVSVASRPGAHGFDDFRIFNGPCTAAVMREMVRGLGYNLRYRLGAL